MILTHFYYFKSNNLLVIRKSYSEILMKNHINNKLLLLKNISLVCDHSKKKKVFE